MRPSPSSPASGPAAFATRLLALTLSLASISEVAAAPFTSVTSPQLDLSTLGRVALAGDFDAVSLYEWEGQNEDTYATNGSHSLLTRFPNGAFTALQTADAYIEAMCPYVKNGELKGVMVGGNFTSLGGVETQGAALFNPNTSKVEALSGLSGRVSSLYCDADSGIVYLGGSFSGANSTNALAWDGNWTGLPFAGFNGPVSAITKTSSGRIVFGGSFDGLGNTTTSTPKNPDSQPIAISSANISASASSSTSGFDDPTNIVCEGGEDESGSSWLLPNDTAGYWLASFDFGFAPTKVRLYNTKHDGRGTKTWRFTALPDGGIMNLTYTTSTGEKAYCDARCPLPEGNSSAQDFEFVYKGFGMNAFRIDISDWYGSGGGLSGIEIFEDDIYTYAIERFNNPNCSTETTKASATSTGEWTETASGESSSKYLTLTVDGDLPDPLPSVVFKPNILQSGNYSVLVYTPGCIQDDTCSTRGRINVTGTMTPSTSSASSEPISTELYQTNNYDKYDTVYSGYIDADDDSFTPSVTLAPSSDQSGSLTFVAQRVRFVYRNGSSSGLNGLYEYDPSSTTVETDFTNSTIDSAGNNLEDDASISALVTVDNTTYVAGNFSNSNFSNIFSISGSQVSSLAGDGLDAEVLTMYHNGSLLYVGGNFTETKDGKTTGLGGVAAYSISEDKWQALGAGVNGQVSYIVPFSLNVTQDEPETVIALTGTFSKTLAFDDSDEATANNLAVWVPSRSNWLHNLDDAETISLNGQLIAQTEVPGFDPLFAGAVSSQALRASGAVGLDEQSNSYSLQRYPVKIQPQQTTVTSSKKRATSSATVDGAVTGIMLDDDGLNITVIAGHFTAEASDGTTVNNIIFINGTSTNTTVSGMGDEIDSDSAFLSVALQDAVLYAGGSVTGTVQSTEINGLVVYDLQANTYASPQPAALAGTNVTVNAVAPQPSSHYVYVGGNFQSAGSLPCAGLCYYDSKHSQWNRPGNGISGTVSTLFWASGELLIGGDMTINGNKSTVAKYNPKNSEFTVLASSGQLPGAVTTLCPANNAGDQFWVAGKMSNGSAFLEKYDGSDWRTMGISFGEGTTISGLQIFELSVKHDKADLIDTDQALLVMGSLNIHDFGNASAALYNGTHIQPFLLATTASNGQGSMSQAFVQNPQNFFTKKQNHMKLGLVVLISLAIALGCTFLIVALGIIAERLRRKREGYTPAPTQMFDKTSNIDRVPPEHLFGTLGQSQRRL